MRNPIGRLPILASNSDGVRWPETEDGWRAGSAVMQRRSIIKRCMDVALQVSVCASDGDASFAHCKIIVRKIPSSPN